MNEFILLAFLVTGEVSLERVDLAVCTRAYAAIEAGEVVALDLRDGRPRVRVMAVSCIPVADVEGTTVILAEEPKR